MLKIYKMKRKNRLVITSILIVTFVALIFTFNINTESQSKLTNLDDIEKYREDLIQITCYCGCEHTSLYNCHEEGMLTNCGICMKEFEDYQELKEEGKTIKEISDIIDRRYG